MFDLHTHFIPPEVLLWLKDNQNVVDAKWEQKGPDRAEFLIVNNKWGFELKESFINPALYLLEQEKAGVSHSVVSPVPQLFLYDFPEQITAELSSVYNRALASWVREHKKRLSAFATIPLNSPVRAANELKSAMGLGLRGAIIGPGLSKVMLTDEFFNPFWEEANHQKAIIFIHPLLCEDPRLKQRMMPNLIGVPWETTICAADLLLSGLLDKYPDVKVLLAHGGGFLPYQIGRLNKGYEQWTGVSASLQAPPADYLRRFWFDSVLWTPASLRYLAEVVGEDKIVPGSDFPFDLCAWPPATYNESGVRSLLNEGS
ncbi:amidohydrolase family protein [Paenactinomyces guangxiensis]|uniref:Amidohydrolase n=1 Tax=Paenactinomyces guangxiensis TaxID=1490290 RepID=A0A7W1WP85_9BACL|nr:amidohydrolase family protein [Paenactinomyces guangxiensis]MBA4493554.1 amidohydrolase [Paenactinomyces guangxiensis]MBH8590645.1 amidohydrolase [Paenactinomyces guangxiensis]